MVWTSVFYFSFYIRFVCFFALFFIFFCQLLQLFLLLLYQFLKFCDCLHLVSHNQRAKVCIAQTLTHVKFIGNVYCVLFLVNISTIPTRKSITKNQVRYALRSQTEFKSRNLNTRKKTCKATTIENHTNQRSFKHYTHTHNVRGIHRTRTVLQRAALKENIGTNNFIILSCTKYLTNE